ncbi:MAG: hypothetical protein D6681_09770 [Calditrichaeota bacterium]|nr:MAG: hypothetical protein D6681_09770 [Calditrichota bacterium]
MGKLAVCSIITPVMLLVSIVPTAGFSEEPPAEACLSLCDAMDSDFQAFMAKAGIPAYPNGCSSGRGSGGVHRSLLVLDPPEKVLNWYRKRLNGWHEFRDGATHVLYAGPEVNPNDPEIREFGWDYSERTRIEIVGKKQHYGMCEWPTTITININVRK